MALLALCSSLTARGKPDSRRAGAGPPARGPAALRWGMPTPLHLESSRAVPVEVGDAYDRLPTGSLRPLVSHVDGRWAFAPEGTGVRVTWSWTLHPTSTYAARVLPLVGRMWQGYARQALEQTSDVLLALSVAVRLGPGQAGRCPSAVHPRPARARRARRRS